MLRILSRAGHNVIAFANTKKAVGYSSRYGEKRIFSTLEELKKQISDITKSSNEKISCIITDGELLGSIVSNYPELYDICNVQSGPYSLVKMLAHKNLMYEFASSRGLNYARFVLLSEYKQGELDFPVILKRNFEIPLFFKVKKIESEEDFSEFVKKIKKEDYKHIMVQEYITDDPVLNISFQGYFINGACKCSFICSQDRRISAGITSYLNEIGDNEIKEMIKRKAETFFKESGYTGFTELEFLYSEETHEIYFIEINTRTCGLHSVLKFKYPDLPLLYDNINNPPELTENPALLSWINIARDIKARIQNKDFKNISQLFTSKHDVFDWHDLKPFFYQFVK